MSNLIYLTDRVDALIVQHDGSDILCTRHIILDTIKKYRGILFETRLTNTFLDVANSEYFWLMLDSRHLSRYIMEMDQKSKPQKVGRNTFREMAIIFAEIVDAKSSFTVEHSLGVARLAKFIASLVGLSDDKQDML